MRAAVLTAVLFLSGCYIPEHNCITRGGLYVDHAACTPELETMQARIEYEAEQLGFRPHMLEGSLLFAITLALNEHGAFMDGKTPVRGLTDCPMGTVEVAQWNDEAWTTTALAHEAFHLAQDCFYDTAALNACRSLGGKLGEDGPALEFRCNQEAQHPGWSDSIYPAIARINAGGAL